VSPKDNRSQLAVVGTGGEWLGRFFGCFGPRDGVMETFRAVVLSTHAVYQALILIRL